jgi:hypothetical protein
MIDINNTTIETGTPEVEKFFSIEAKNRNISTLEKINFTNADLMEILNISEEIEHHPLSKNFYTYLIASRDDNFIFSNLVFINFLKKGKLPIKTLTKLFNNTEDLSEKNKYDWLDYTTYHFPHWFPDNYDLIQLNIFKHPFNKLVATNLIEFVSSKDVSKLIISIFNSLDENEFVGIFKKNLSNFKSNSELALFLSKCENSPKDILQICYDLLKRDDDKELIGTHKNCPKPIKIELFKKTQDIKFLPDHVKDMFLF